MYLTSSAHFACSCQRTFLPHEVNGTATQARANTCHLHSSPQLTAKTDSHTFMRTHLTDRRFSHTCMRLRTHAHRTPRTAGVAAAARAQWRPCSLNTNHSTRSDNAHVASCTTRIKIIPRRLACRVTGLHQRHKASQSIDTAQLHRRRIHRRRIVSTPNHRRIQPLSVWHQRMASSRPARAHAAMSWSNG